MSTTQRHNASRAGRGEVFRSASRCRGVAMLLVMISVLIAGVLSVSFLASQSTTTTIASNVERHAEARGVAESGLSYAVAYLQETDDWRDTLTPGQVFADVAFPGGVATIRFDDETDDFTDDTAEPALVRVVGEAGGVSHRVEARVTPTASDELRVLLVVDDADRLEDQDVGKRNLFASWGYRVTLLEDNASASDYEDAVAGVDVVYVSETCNSGTVGTKLTHVSKGVVADEGYLADDLGLSNHNGTGTSAREIDITAGSHPITAALGTGDIPLFHSWEGAWLYWNLGSGVQTLAELWGHPTLVAAERGAPLADGSLAAGRRVLTPWGGSGFEVDELTTDGQALLRACLDWAAAEPPDIDGLTAEWHFNTGDPNSVDNIDWNDDPDETTVVANVDFPGPTSQPMLPGGPNDNFALRLTGKIKIERAGSWSFRLTSDDGSRLNIAGSRVVNNDGDHATRSETGSVTLTADRHAFEVLFYENRGNTTLELEWRGPGVDDWEIVPASAFVGTPQPLDVEPQLVALYEFEKVEVTPRLISRWPFDRLTSTNQSTPIQAAAGDEIDLPHDSRIDSYSSLNGPYGGANVGQSAQVATNSTSSNHVMLMPGTTFAGDVMVGPGGDPDRVVRVTGSAELTGQKRNLLELIDVSDPADPDGELYPRARSDWEDEDTEREIGEDDTETYLACRDWEIEDSVITIRGDVNINVEDDFEMEGSQILLAEGATLRLYCGGIAYVRDSEINPDSSRTADFTFINYGSGHDQDMRLYAGTVIAGAIRSADDVEFQAGATLYGTVFAEDDLKELHGRGRGGPSRDGAMIHVDVTLGLAGDTFVDVGNLSHAYASGGVGLAEGHDANSADFDGQNDFIEIAHHDDYLLEEGSVSFWFYPKSTSGQQGLVTKDSLSYDDGGHFRVVLDGDRVSYRLQSVSDDDTITHPAAIRTGRWYHVVASWGPDGMLLYVNDADPARETSRTHGLGTSAGGSGNREPWVVGADSWRSDDESSDGVEDFFEGRIDEVRVYDRSLNAQQVATVRADGTPGSAIAAVVKDTSSYGDPLDLTIDNHASVDWLDGGGLDVTGEVRIASGQPASKIHDALTSTDQITLEAIFTPANLSQDGPARIVSMSEDGNRRNFTLGQDDADYAMRLRTTETSSNGTPEADAGASFVVGQSQHVIISYSEAGGLVMRRNGMLEREMTDRGGSFSGWDDSMRLILANEFDTDRHWRGRLTRVAIYDRAVDRVQAERMFDGSDPGLPGSEDEVSLEIVWVEGP